MKLFTSKYVLSILFVLTATLTSAQINYGWKCKRGATVDGLNLHFVHQKNTSIAIRFRISRLANEQYIINEQDVIKLVIDSNGYVNFHFLGNQKSYVNLNGKTKVFGPGVRNGRWYHAVITKENLNYKLYLDGELQATVSYSTKFHAPSKLNFNINDSDLLDAVDDFGVWLRTLSPMEVSMLNDGKIVSENQQLIFEDFNDKSVDTTGPHIKITNDAEYFERGKE